MYSIFPHQTCHMEEEPMLYEVRTYTLQPGTVAEFEARFAKRHPLREKHSKLGAFWHTEIGPLNQVIHVWPYDDLQHFAENTPLDASGLTAALSGWQQTLQWSGEMAAQIPTQAMALLQDRLLAEASTAAWQEYFLFNAVLAILCLFPALPCWRRTKYQTPTTPQAVAVPARSAATSNGIPTPQASRHDNPARTS